MAKPLIFEFDGAEIALRMNKVDRARLYGFKELLVLDEEGKPCDLATLAEDGRKVIGRGGTGIGYLTADGQWVSRDELRPVNLEGETIVPVKSSLGQTIRLDNVATMERFLDHSIRLVYFLEQDETPIPESLLETLRAGTIYEFEYSYRGGLVADAGFLLANDEGELFLLVGEPSEIHFVGLRQAAPVSTDDDAPASADDEDAMDFGMI